MFKGKRRTHGLHSGVGKPVRPSVRLALVRLFSCRSLPISPPNAVGHNQGGYIFYAGASLAGAGYCRQCRRRPAILPLQLRQGCQVCVKISAQRLPRVAQFYAC